MIDVTVVVGTFGAQEWMHLAQRRAVPSAKALGVPVVHVHAGTLHEARNEGVAQVATEWVCHLDADDELEDGYFDAMARAGADLRAPAVRYITADGLDTGVRMPRVAGHRHDCTGACLAVGNWLVVGTLVRADLVRQVGGWHDFPVYEDYDLWVRCHLAGATVEAVPDAVYRAHVRHDSRNRGPSHDLKHSTHQAIARSNGIPVPA